MSIPKVDSDMSFSESADSSPEVLSFKKIKKEEDEGMIIPEQPVHPPEIINISDDDDLSSIESCFMHESPKEKAPEPRTYENEVIEIMETGQEESSPERDTEVNKKREYETAFSVTSPVEIKNMIKRNKFIKTKNKNSPEQQEKYQKHLEQEEAMWNINNHHKAIMDYAKFVNKNDLIDSCRQNNMNMDHTDYTKIITRDLPKLHSAINPISKISLIKEVQNKILNLSPPEWHKFSKNRSKELR